MIKRFRRGCTIAAGLLAIAAGPVRASGTEPPPSAPEEVITVHVCDLDAPPGWAVIEEASGFNEHVVLCNFRINDATAGTAITVEYYCTAAEGEAAFSGKTGQRDTETFRSTTKVITEEGTAAGTEAGRDRGIIVSTFFPDVDFALQQKEFVLFNSQTVATIVVLTNDRVVSIESGVEAAAIVVAANHTPQSVPGCEITPVAVASPGTGSAPSGGKGGGGGRVGIVLGGGAVVTVGGVIVWRRRKGRPPIPRANVGHVPPQCIGQQQAFEHVRERVLTLQEAFQELNENLARAEKNHHYNKLRTIAILGIDAGTTIGGAVGSAVKLRPSARRSVPLQADTWKPPLNLDPRLANILRRAQAILEAAAERATAARRNLAALTSQLADLANAPMVRAARERVTALAAALERATAGLAGSTAARQAIDVLDDKIAKVGAAAAENSQRVAGLERMLERQTGWLTSAADDLAKLTDTMDGPGSGPRLGPIDPRVDRKQMSLASLQRDLKRTVDELAEARINAADATKNVESLVSQRESHMRDLAKHGDVLDRDVAKLRESHTKALADANSAHMQAATDLNQKRIAAQAALSTAEMEESLANTYRKNLASQIDLHSSMPPPGLARRVLHGSVELLTLPLLPVVWMFEKGFGRTQSLPEAVEILIRGERRVTELTRQLSMVERAVTQQRTEAQRLRTVLDQCVKQWEGAA